LLLLLLVISTEATLLLKPEFDDGGIRKEPLSFVSALNRNFEYSGVRGKIVAIHFHL